MEKTRKLDNYDLINSKAIGNYCRKLKYQFNTEELAVLVFRNKEMDINEKIEKYQDLIDNYPDMEVIKRINCEHYDSVKIMIKNEITRLKELYSDLISNDNSAYIWYEYDRLSRTYSSPISISDHLYGTYQDTYNDVVNYINEFDDTLSFTIVKKKLDKSNKTIVAEFSVINKKPKLIKLYDRENDYLDIDNIYVYMPTPFKKGDILVSKNPSGYNFGDNGDLFVLDYLSTWRENIKEYLKKGNSDSSDMVGYGYYLYEDTAQFTYDNRWDYDSFEYYKGNFEGNNRILKAISSYVKGEIDMEVLIHAYDVFKIESINKAMPDFYGNDVLKKAGFSDEEIKKING